METTLTYYHLGSWTTITDEKGSIEREQSFDAWGKMRDPYTWREFPSGGTCPQGPMFDRGFTGHEHLFEFGLINMNGRMYDPVMSTFLSVDNYVSSPDFSQAFNRYAYCFNNPLKYTDPSGEIAVVDDIIIAALIGGTINAIIQGCTGNINSAGDFALAFGVGALSGAVGAWAGGAAFSAAAVGGFQGGFAAGLAGGAAGGFVGGAGNAWCNGASFGNGLIAGWNGAITGALIGGITGGLSRGIAARNRGFDFWDGTKISFYDCDGLPLSSETVTVEGDIDGFLRTRVNDTFSTEVKPIKEGELGLKKITTKYESNYMSAKDPITGIDEDGLYVHKSGRHSAGYTVGTDWSYQEMHISPYATKSDIVTFKAIVGHELDHVYHNYVGYYTFLKPECALNSEKYAWAYTMKTYAEAGNWDMVGAVFEKAKELGYFGAYSVEYAIPSHYKFSMSWR